MLKVECDVCKNIVELGDAYGPGVPVREEHGWGLNWSARLYPQHEGAPEHVFLAVGMGSGDPRMSAGDPNFTVCTRCVLDGMESALRQAGRLGGPHSNEPSTEASDGRTGGNPDVSEVPPAPDVSGTGPDLGSDDVTQVHVEPVTEVHPNPDALTREHLQAWGAPEPGGIDGRQHVHHERRFRRRSTGQCAHCVEFPGCLPRAEAGPLPRLRDLRGSSGKDGGPKG